MRYFLSIFLLITSFSLHAQEEEIYVQLASEVELIPIYVSQIQVESEKLASSYAESIRQIFLFDLNHNGMTRSFTNKEIQSHSSLQDQNVFDSEIDFVKLKNEGLLYLIKLKLKDQELIAKVVSVNAQTGTQIDHIFISGDISKDRQKIHQLSDSVHKLLFGKSGIATSRILYTVKVKIDRPKQEPKWISEVFMADYDGHNVKQLTHDGCLSANPLFLPTPAGQCSSFLYVSYKIGQPKIYMGSLNDKIQTRVSQLRANQVTPAVNINGSLIAFSSDVSGRADIFLQPLNRTDEASKPRQIFTAKGAANASPAFSPDGKKIAFVSNKDGSPKIYVMPIPPVVTKLKDLKLQLISKRCRENSAPAWSPDGKKLAYCARSSAERQIWIYDFETGLERQLTQGKADKENPTWASNSLHLLFDAKEGSGTELFLINLNQPEAVKITSGSGAKLFPSWEPKQI